MWYPPKERIEQLESQLAALDDRPSYCDDHFEDFLVRISACIRQLAVNKLVPPSYLRDWIWIGSQFRIHYMTDKPARRLRSRAGRPDVPSRRLCPCWRR